MINYSNMKFFLEYTKKEERIKEVKCFIFNKILHFCLINIRKIHSFSDPKSTSPIFTKCSLKNQPLPSYITLYSPFVFTIRKSKSPSTSTNDQSSSSFSLSRPEDVGISCWFLLSLFSWFKLSFVVVESDNSDKSVDGENDDNSESSFDSVVRFYI